MPDAKDDSIVLRITLERLREMFGDKLLLTVDETARAFGFDGPGPIYYLLRRKTKKKFPVRALRVGGRVRFNIVEVAQFMAEGA